MVDVDTSAAGDAGLGHPPPRADLEASGPEASVRPGHGESPARRLPQFVIIGAAKAATTWLSTVLRQQPGVFMPEPEVHFFNRNYERGPDWYAASFAAARPGQIVGEKSASYLSDPRVPSRLARLLPEARLIVQLRDPVQRAYSDYCMLLRRGEVGADIERHLDPAAGRAAPATTRRFLEDGLYARHLQAFLEHFPRGQIEVLLYDDIALDAGRAFARVAAFVGLADPVPPEAPGRRVKDKATPMLPLPIRRLLRPLKAAARPWRDRPLFEGVRGLLVRPVLYPPLGEALAAQLAAYYADDVRALAGLLGRDLSGWPCAGGAGNPATAAGQPPGLADAAPAGAGAA